MKIKASIEALVYEAAFYSASIEDGALSALGELTERASGTLRVLATLLLLGRADYDRYAHNLTRSGCARAAFLRRTSAMEGRPDWRRCASRSAPALQDAIAAEAWDIAGEVAAGTPRTWFSRNEYKSDFAGVMALMALLPGVPASEAEAALADFATALDGDADPTLSVLTAIAAGDQRGFDAAFDDLMVARDEELRASRARGEIEDDGIFARRHLHIPGLALLRLAGRHGLAVRERPPLCPDLALQSLKVAYVRDL